jgi:hypothetical protein
MQPQTPVAPPPKIRGEINLHLVLTVFLGIGMVLFGALAIYAFRDNDNIHRNLNAIIASAKDKAAADQKNKDEADFKKQNELPYKTYIADAVDGAFKLQIPKNWSVYTGKSDTGTTQLDLRSDPDVVSIALNNGISSNAFKLQILRQGQPEVLQSKFQDKIKTKKVTSKQITVSGISAIQLDGLFDDQRHNGVVTILPVRDKTMVISTDTHNNLTEYNQILSSAQISP